MAGVQRNQDRQRRTRLGRVSARFETGQFVLARFGRVSWLDLHGALGS
jgi:hypothetical protein